MNEEIDEGDFYHQDFTTASEWEIFIARMEEIIHEWKIQDTKNDLSSFSTTSNNWNIKTEKIPFTDVEFTLSQYNKHNLRDVENDDLNNETKALTNLHNAEYDFLQYNGKGEGPEYSIEYWYGLQSFILLAASGNKDMNNESHIKILLSSINIVISNSGCEVPIFVQIREKWQRCYQGIYESNGTRTNFEMVHLRKGLQHCKYLTGLLDVFKTKISSPIPLEPVTVSVQLSYHLDNWMNSTWAQESHEFDGSLDHRTISKLRFGVNFDPVSKLALNATWLQLPEHLVVDSENYSDFDPLQAPKWSAEVTMAERPVCMLSECLSEFFSLFSDNSSLQDILGDLISVRSDSSNPLDRLTESRIPIITSVVKRAENAKRKYSRANNAPITEETLVTVLYYLFPEAVENSEAPYTHSGAKETVSEGSFANENEVNSDVENMCRGLKTCVVDSLVWRLSVVLALAMVSLGGVKTVCYLWYEFIEEMRYRWEKSIIIPGIARGFPDHRTCLLHQKLQMLNCCIERKRKREAAASSCLASSSSEDEDSEDEYFDCDTEEETKKIRHSLWNKPVGRLSKHGNLKLLTNGSQLYIPVTQEPVPKTEDQLEEDTDVLLKLGSDAQGSELRARMMSASLLSDMESFKAANPDAILEDFIRWYSPRDWIEEDELDQWGQKKGHLSSRMLISDNTWVQVWESAKPVPANRQKRLFDDTKEAEKVLHFLDSRSPTLIAELLFPVLSHAAIHRLAEEIEGVLPVYPELSVSLRHIIKTIERLSRDPRIPAHKYESVILEINNQELIISQINSLLFKFNPTETPNDRVNEFVSNLVTGREVIIDGGAQSFIGCRLIHMFSEAQKEAKMITEPSDGEPLPQNLQTQRAIFPQATKREFVMRVAAVRPAAYSAKTDQMLRAIFSKNEFRLCGAFTEDITFG